MHVNLEIETKLRIIQIYAPFEGTRDAEFEKYHKIIQNVREGQKKSIIIQLGVMRARINVTN